MFKFLLEMKLRPRHHGHTTKQYFKVHEFITVSPYSELVTKIYISLCLVIMLAKFQYNDVSKIIGIVVVLYKTPHKTSAPLAGALSVELYIGVYVEALRVNPASYACRFYADFIR